MKRFYVFIIVFCINHYSFSQGSITLEDKPFNISVTRDTSLENQLRLLPEYTSLSHEEKEVVYWVNLVRTQPRDFVKQVIHPFLEQFPEAKSSYSQSLIKELNHQPPLPALLPSSRLHSIAETHAKDLGQNQMPISHQSSRGESFQERMNRFGYFECVSENIYEGKENGLFSVLFLLIDAGVKSLGHRKNILSPEVKYIGVSFHPIRGKERFYYLVQNFSCD